MTRRLTSLVFTALCGILTVFAEQIRVDSQIAISDCSATVDIVLSNEHIDLVAFQMDLLLPEGVEIDKTECFLSSRITDSEQKLTIGKLENGAYRLTSASLSLTPISGNDDILLTLKLQTTSSFVRGQAEISNIRFATTESERVVIDNVSFSIYNDNPDAIEMSKVKSQMSNGKYDLSGRKLNKVQRGINIVRYPNGVTKRIYIK